MYHKDFCTYVDPHDERIDTAHVLDYQRSELRSYLLSAHLLKDCMASVGTGWKGVSLDPTVDTAGDHRPPDVLW